MSRLQIPVIHPEGGAASFCSLPHLQCDTQMSHIPWIQMPRSNDL